MKKFIITCMTVISLSLSGSALAATNTTTAAQDQQVAPKEIMTIDLSQLQAGQTSVLSSVYYEDGVKQEVSLKGTLKDGSLYVTSKSISGNLMFERAISYPETDMAIIQKNFEDSKALETDVPDIGVRYFFERAGYEVKFDSEKQTLIIYSKNAPVVALDLDHVFPAAWDGYSNYIYSYGGVNGELGGYIDSKGRLMISGGYYVFPFDQDSFNANKERPRLDKSNVDIYSTLSDVVPLRSFEKQGFKLYYDSQDKQIIMFKN